MIDKTIMFTILILVKTIEKLVECNSVEIKIFLLFKKSNVNLTLNTWHRQSLNIIATDI